MTGLLIIAISVTAMVLAFLLFTTDEKLLRRFASAKKKDRVLKNTQFFAAVVTLVAIEAILLRFLGCPVDLQIAIIALSAYMPMTFFFFCNVFQVGNRRELIWVCVFLILCGASILLVQELRLEWILPISVSFTILLCYLASKDAYTYYRRGLRCLDEKGQLEKAILAFETANRMCPENLVFRYHLGRCHLVNGDAEKGNGIIQSVVAAEPDFIDNMRRDPLFRDEWLPPDSEA